MLIPAPGIHHATTEHGTAILNIPAGTWHMLDADSSRVWTAITRRGGTAGLADEIAVPAGLDPATVTAAVERVVDELLDLGVLTDLKTAQPRRPRKWWHRR
ncbi:PqqD family protein [Streptomyces griseus]|uniref:PqqD family protein n=1 Tax=Streptomyces stephensoniae TaxID=3375367 RepID=A0ABU2WBJ5_9ACTN|nr:PqqD family protein [Streptomyces griseus]MDT0495232.1 PqqD family protein [Streptomyces griseus]